MPAFAASETEIPTPKIRSVVRVDEKTGHLVRSVVRPPGSPALPPESTELIRMINRIAAEEGVEDSLVHSVIRAESNYNPFAVSPKGAQGMMQLIPSTARRFGVTNAFDAHDNVLGGVKYLKFLLDYYQNDYVRAIAAYNAGEMAVDKFQGVPPFTETRNYVLRVAANLKSARARRQAPTKIAASPAAVVSYKEETYRRIETSVGSDGRVYYRTP